MRTRLIILGCLLLAGILVPSFAQTNEEYSLQGEWVFESISAFEKGVQKIPFSADSINCCGVPIEMNIQQDDVIFVYKNDTRTEKYNLTVKGNVLCFLICTQWTIVGNKLQLQWYQDVDKPEEELGKRDIVVTYKRK